MYGIASRERVELPDLFMEAQEWERRRDEAAERLKKTWADIVDRMRAEGYSEAQVRAAQKARRLVWASDEVGDDSREHQVTVQRDVVARELAPSLVVVPPVGTVEAALVDATQGVL